VVVVVLVVVLVVVVLVLEKAAINYQVVQIPQVEEEEAFPRVLLGDLPLGHVLVQIVLVFLHNLRSQLHHHLDDFCVVLVDVVVEEDHGSLRYTVLLFLREKHI
jgi:hypothetical protein